MSKNRDYDQERRLAFEQGVRTDNATTSEPIPVIGLGAGGHAKVVIEILQQRADVRLLGLLDADPEAEPIFGIPVIGNDSDLPLWRDECHHAFLGVGTANDTRLRQRLYQYVLQQGFSPFAAIHPTAYVSPSAQAGRGVTIGPGAIIHTDATLGENVLVNTAAVIEHDCRIDDHVHVATGAKVAGGVQVGKGAFIGAGAVVLPGVTVGENTVIGAGTVVVRDAPADAIMVGIPAQRLRRSA